MASLGVQTQTSRHELDSGLDSGLHSQSLRLTHDLKKQ